MGDLILPRADPRSGGAASHQLLTADQYNLTVGQDRTVPPSGQDVVSSRTFSPAPDARPDLEVVYAVTSTNGDRRSRLLSAAVELFSTQPYDQISMDEIADRAGTAHGLAFHYFGSKRGLFIEALRDIAERINAVQADIPMDRPAYERLAIFIRRHLDFVRSNPALLNTLMRGARGLHHESAPLFEELHARGARRIADLLEIYEPSRTWKFMVRGWIGCCDELCLAWVLEPDVISAEELAQTLLEQLMNVLAKTLALETAALRVR